MAQVAERQRSDDVAWHGLPVDEALGELAASSEGLDEEEARRRVERYGPNELPQRGRAGLARVFLRQFTDPLIYILLIAAVVSLVIGSYQNAAFIGAVLLINAGIGTLQEWKAESSAQALQSVIQIAAVVRRGGERREVPSEELVPGDVVLIEAGASVPADLRLLSSAQVRADESLLTGESTPVDKDAAAEVPEDAPVGDRATLLHAGSSVLGGKGEGVVVRTGQRSEVGRIARSLAEGQAQEPPLLVKMRRFTRIVALVILGAVALLAGVQLLRGAAWQEIFFLAVALSVSAIPAGLPVAMTVALSIASTRMAKRHVIVRQLPAVEGLGSCTLIASDKTGTLTANDLMVERVLLPDGVEVEVSGAGLAPEGELTCDGEAPGDEQREAVARLAASAALANEGDYRPGGEGEGDEEAPGPQGEGDPNDVAFLVLAHKLGLERESLRSEHAERGFVPFESDRRFAASFNEDDGQLVGHVKGAAETVLEMCEGVDTDDVLSRAEALAGRGYRVLAVARGVVSPAGEPGVDDLRGLELLGLVGLIDPTREEVPEAVEAAHRAGVQVRMITGDHPATGLAIARDLGLTEGEEEALTGRELAEGEPDAERIGRARVFARVEPAQKTTIVDRLQEAGHFVAVTGDGVNDAPALRRAHIGVAMGQGGTDVARGAADLILTDDNFASIVAGIEEGRVAYDNVRKVIWLLLATGAAEVLLFFVALFLGIPIPLTPIQLLWLNLVTNGIQDVALAFEKGEPGVLDRPPRDPDQPIIDRQMVEQIVVSGVWIGGVAFGVYYYLYAVVGMEVFAARNLTLLLMVLFENAHIFSCRSERRSIFQVPLSGNYLLIGTVLAAQGVHIGALYLPGLKDVLEVEPVSLLTWLQLLPIALSVLVIDEVAKLVRRKLEERRDREAAPAPA